MTISTSGQPEAAWVFDALPPSGARRGGDPSEHVFRPDLETFVREVVQNANDQSLASPRVRFGFQELSGESLKAFLAAMDWQNLEPHLRAAAKMRGGHRIRSALHEMDSSGRLLLVCIEDSNTVGLTGEEFEGDSHFRALCKDTLFSHKAQAGAGGSYGLGKSVLWAFSGLSTVLFNSVLQKTPAGKRSPRLIGRAELPSHEAEKRWFTGSGWFGAPQPVPGGQFRAESIWSLTAAMYARELHLVREDSNTGTSLLIVGFREPASDEEASLDSLRKRMARGALLNFWPAMVMPRGLQISLTPDAPLAPTASPEIKPFVDCYRGGQQPQERLDRPGDVVVREIELEIPARLDGSRAIKAPVRLMVRLGEEGAEGAFSGHVAMFRGPGMVVRYWDRSALAPPGCVFQAVLACGEARDPEVITDSDREVERFLRLAEPPGHDEWGSTASLKDEYRRGYAKSLEQLKDRVGQTLREVLSKRIEQGSRGPEKLQRRFPIGSGGPGGGGSPSAFHFSGLNAFVENGSWRFSGIVQPVRRGKGWQAIIRLREMGDAQTPLAEIPIEHLEVDGRGTELHIDDGVALVTVPRGISAIAFTGRSVPVGDGRMEELRLEITSEQGGAR